MPAIDQAWLDAFDPTDAGLYVDPYPTFQRYRERDPVHFGTSNDPASPGTWYTFGFDVSEQVLIDVDNFASDPAAVGRSLHAPPGWETVGHVFQKFLGGIDPPDHVRLRTVLAKAFSPREIERLADRVRGVATRMLDDTFRAPGRTFDLVSDFAFPFPMLIIGKILGVDEEHSAQFKAASAAIAAAIDSPGDLSVAREGSSAIDGLLAYFSALIAERRERPRGDVLSAMVDAAALDGEILTEGQLMAIAVELLVAGHETTVNAIAIGTLGLRENPEAAWALSRAEAGDLDRCVEEMLRWTSPSQRQRPRWAVRTTEVGGRTIERGQPVVVMTAAANRDPIRFPDPDVLRFDRQGKRHLTFGRGPHFCLGANLARLELRVALPQIAAVIGRLELPDRADIVWRRNTLLPGPAAVPISVPPR